VGRVESTFGGLGLRCRLRGVDDRSSHLGRPLLRRGCAFLGNRLFLGSWLGNWLGNWDFFVLCAPPEERQEEEDCR
jgi:hypothetical protein